ncbi:MAG: translation initiation factor IF-2 [Candidatus Paceibacterota bacterium]|jgi:translation initiation factor IF-2
MEQKNQQKNTASRPPIVVVMGHIDHGKSTLLDYIRKTNIVDSETGGITQTISAYEVVHKDEAGLEKKITFLDTPGHEAFSKMRERGALIADIAILVVSAEDGVKPQTIEAWKTIAESKIPCIVAINKIDKPGANIEKTKIELAENEIYLENYGGQIPVAEISAKVGTGVDNLLSLILILAEVENFTGNASSEASGFVIEVNLDSRRGILGTLVLKDGTLKKGMTVAVEDTTCSTRIMENFKGEVIGEATFSSPIRIVGFDKMPRVGAEFISFDKKSDAEKFAKNWKLEKSKDAAKKSSDSAEADKKILPIILKADVAGSLEAIAKEIAKIKSESAEFRIVASGVGPITESDIKGISGGSDALVIGFNVKTDRSAHEVAEQRGITITNFDIIYKLAEWLVTEMEDKRPKVETSETVGRAKIIRAFSRTKERQIVGGKVMEGELKLNSVVKIMRRDFEIGRGKIVNLEKSKAKVSSVEEGAEFGMMVESKIEIVQGDVIESFTIVKK